jgi:pimeloyl-ACP methyl ester carboxylesterase
MNWLTGALLGVAALVIVGLGALLWFTRTVARGLLFPLRKAAELQPANVGLDDIAQDVRISGPRGTLAAWYIPSRNSCTLLCLHGVGDYRGQWLEQVARLRARSGYGALLLDFLGHGESDTAHVTYGALEREDVAAALDWLRARGDVDMNGVGVMGYSLGAITATLAAANSPELRALVIESGFADLPHDIARIFTRFTHLPAFPFVRLVIYWGERMTGVKLNQIRPASVIGQLSPRPVLIISDLSDGLADEPYDGERLYAAAGEPKELWQIPEATHIQAFWRDPDAWVARVGGFFDTYLTPHVAAQETAKTIGETI